MSSCSHCFFKMKSTLSLQPAGNGLAFAIASLRKCPVPQGGGQGNCIVSLSSLKVLEKLTAHKIHHKQCYHSSPHGTFMKTGNTDIGHREPGLRNVDYSTHYAGGHDRICILCCVDRGAASLTWLWGNEPHKDVPHRWHISEHQCSDNVQQICSRLTINKAIASDTGYFTCVYNHLLSNKGLMAKTYVFVTGKSFILLDLLSTLPHWRCQ